LKSHRQLIKGLLQRLGYTCRATRSLPVGADLFLDLRRLSIEPTGTIFDVGAHVGHTAATFCSVYPSARVYCFEPSPETFKTLVQNCGSKNVSAVNMALGSCVGTEQMYAVKDSYLNSLVSQLNSPRPDSSQVTVRVTTLDQFCEEHGVRHIDFLKTDTEGYELEVLKGATRLLREKRIGAIYVECAVARCDRHVSATDLLEFLKAYGFRLYGLYEQAHYFEPTSEYQRILLFDSDDHLWCNALFVAETA
jgi:FkbM family methyltransferase